MLPDSKWCHLSEETNKIITLDSPPPHTLSAMQNDSVDIRPRFYSNATKEWILVDTGAQVSAIKPSPGDVIDPNIRLETVDGSTMPCYGKKTLSFKLGRKEYHQEVFISNTNETILGMDFQTKSMFTYSGVHMYLHR